jgi:hypothetical protein
MNIKNQKIVLYLVGLFSVVASMSLINIHLYIDIPSLIVVVVAFIAGHFIYTSKKLSTYMFGVGIFVFILSLVALLLSMSEPEFVYPSIAVALLSFMYFVIVAIYISNISEIYLQPNKEITLPKRTKSFWIAQLALLVVFVLSILMSTGIGGYIDVSSLLLFIPALVALKLVKDDFYRLLVLRNYVLGAPFIATLISVISIISMLVAGGDASTIGPNIALILLSSFYSLYAYFMLLRPTLDEVDLIDDTKEKLYLAFIFFINFSVVLWLVTYAIK